MVTIIYDKATGVIYHQGMRYAIGEKDTYVYDSLDNLKFIFATLDSSNAETAEVDHIESFYGNKFLYQDGEVVLNPDFEE